MYGSILSSKSVFVQYPASQTPSVCNAWHVTAASTVWKGVQNNTSYNKYLYRKIYICIYISNSSAYVDLEGSSVATVMMVPFSVLQSSLYFKTQLKSLKHYTSLQELVFNKLACKSQVHSCIHLYAKAVTNHPR